VFDARLPEATGYDVEVVVLCSEGYTSRLAADALRSLGLVRATDVVGGLRAWAAAGLPTTPEPAPGRAVRRREAGGVPGCPGIREPERRRQR
jgi:hypothetical protein